MQRARRVIRAPQKYGEFLGLGQQSTGLDALLEAAAAADSAGADSDAEAGGQAEDEADAFEVGSEEGDGAAGTEDVADEDGEEAEDGEEEPVSSDADDDSKGQPSTKRRKRDASSGGWTAEEMKQHAELSTQRVKPSTNKQYRTIQSQWKKYAKKHKLPYKVTRKADIPGVGRFFEAWVKGTWGGPYKNRKKTGGQLSPQGAVNVHAAMNQWVRICCTEAGAAVFNLTDDSGYEAMYKAFTQNRNGKRKTLVPVNFTRDHYIKLMHHLYAVNKPSAARTRLMLLLATSAVARGDEIRRVLLSNLAIEQIDVIGPSSCYAVRYALGDNKTDIGLPEQKAFIRGRTPETCTLAALGEYLHSRFKLGGEVLPDPGTTELECLYLFPGSTASQCISYPNHAKLVREALEELAILTEKLTHIPRIFAAQLLIAMGLRVEDVQRAGGWLKDCLGTAYIIFSLSPDGLLALAMWRKDGSDYQCFGDPRFHIAVSDDLLYHALPQLKTFREKADAAVQAALEDGAPAALKQPALTASQMARVLTVATIARIQDAVATADQYPDNPFNADMMGHPDFSVYAAKFKAASRLGGLDFAKPVPMRESMQRMMQGISQLHKALDAAAGNGNLSWAPSSSAPFSRARAQQLPTQPEVPQQQQEPQQQQQQPPAEQQKQQHHPETEPPQRAVEQQQQQHTEQPQQQQTQQQQQQQTQQQQQQQQQRQGPEMVQPPSAADLDAPGNSAAAASAPAAAPTPEANSRGLRTPGGKEYPIGDLPAGYTPQGMHNREFWHPYMQSPFQQQPVSTGCDRQQQQQHQQPVPQPGLGQQQQQQQEESFPQPGLGGECPQQQEQQQQPMYTFEQVQQLIARATAEQQAQQQQTQQKEQLFTQEQVDLFVQQALREQQMQQVRSKPAQQPYAAAVSGAAAMPNANPAATSAFRLDATAQVLQPFISSIPSLAAAVGSRAYAQPSVQHEDATLVLVDLISTACMAGAKEAVLQASAASAAAGCSMGAAVAGCSADGDTGGRVAGTGAAAGTAAAAACVSRAPAQHSRASGRQPKVKLVPGFSTWTSLAHLMKWYCQIEAIPWPAEDGGEVLVSRAYFRDNSKDGSWCPTEKQRASEYDAVYRWLQDYAVTLTTRDNKPVSVMDAVAAVQAEKDIGGYKRKGKMTIPQFMTFCVQEQKEKRTKMAASRRAAAESVEGGAAESVEGGAAQMQE